MFVLLLRYIKTMRLQQVAKAKSLAAAAASRAGLNELPKAIATSSRV
jgi:hypothetical protein